MAAIKTGDAVMIKSREVSGEDEKTGLYYSYFGGLHGTVDRVYDDGSVCVDIELDSLDEEMRKRHLVMQEAERKRWLNNLSGEVRSRLTADQRQLKMSYKLLVSRNDLDSHKGGKPSSKPNADASKADDSSGTTAEGSAGASDRKPSARAAPRPPEPSTTEPESAPVETPTERLSEADIAAREEEYLRSLQKGS